MALVRTLAWVVWHLLSPSILVLLLISLFVHIADYFVLKCTKISRDRVQRSLEEKKMLFLPEELLIENLKSY